MSVVVLPERQFTLVRFRRDARRENVDVAGLQRGVDFRQVHGKTRRALHLADELLVLPAIEPLLDHDRPGESRRNGGKKLAHRIRAADAAEHDDSAGVAGA